MEINVEICSQWKIVIFQEYYIESDEYIMKM